SEKQVVELHSSVEYVVWFLGFQPGFPYLGSLPEQLHTPRRAEPRLLVPAGSVGIGGPQTGVYPLATPGGWQLIGHTSLSLFDPARDEPILLRPGDSVRFVPQKEGIC
ncbi:5-oxoprolinase subunit PxpB, partial [Escherichia coli]